MDLEGDILAEIERILSANGIRYKAQNYESALTDFLTVNRKYIKPKRREVFISKELNARQTSDAQKWSKLRTIIAAGRNGENLNRYQSSRLFEIQFHDYLLYNWNIHHLHLSTEPHKKDARFNKRTEFLVFVRVMPEAIYFLDFASHDDTNIFAQENWLRIIVNNWPHLLTPYDGDPIFSNGEEITTTLRKEMWEKHYAIRFTKVDDKAYVDPGMGVVASGHSLQVMLDRNEIIRWGYEHGKFIVDNKIELEEGFAQIYNLSPEKIVYKARLLPRIQIYEQTTGDILFEYPKYLTKSG